MCIEDKTNYPIIIVTSNKRNTT